MARKRIGNRVSRIATIGVVILILTGCGTTKVRTITEYVDKPIPVYIVPSPPIVKTPELDIYKLDQSRLTLTNENGEIDLATLDLILKSYISSMQKLMSYSDKLKKIYDAYYKIANESENRFTRQLNDPTTDTLTIEELQNLLNSSINE